MSKANSFSLRQFKNADAQALVSLINSKTIADNTTINLPWKLEDATWWLSFVDHIKSDKNRTEVHFAIEIDGALAGSIGLINVVQQRGEIGYWLADHHAGKGIMTSVVKQMVQYCFEEEHLVRIFAPVLCCNKASMKVLEKNGFHNEGVLRKYLKKGNRHLDAVSYSKIK